MKEFIKILLLVSGLTAVIAEIHDGALESRQGRNFLGMSMFSSLNSGSKKDSGTRKCFSQNDEGACYSRSECTRYGGTPGTGDNCGGSGVCCILKSNCLANNTGEAITVLRNMTHLVEPPNYTPPQQCRFNVPKQRGVCQLRLDFKKFELFPPDVLGNCNADTMVITGADNVHTLSLCGDATKEHLYLHYGSSDVISISVNLLNSNSSAAKSAYDILVTMIKCTSPELAPDGCTQYYSQTSDEIRSFNYNRNRLQINDQEYTVCVKSFTGSSRIKWERCSSSDDFFISGTAPTGSLIDSNCVTDYVEILGAGKYCGSSFPLSVSSTARPFLMFVRFDSQEIPLPNTPWNEELGCYETWSCYNELGVIQLPGTPTTPNVNLPCNKVETQYCRPPDWFSVNTDFGNTGFCLRYTVS